MSRIQHTVLDYLARRACGPLAFWTGNGTGDDLNLMAACDTLYALKFIGRMDLLTPDAGQRFATLLRQHRLAGGIGKGEGRPLGIHLTAYVLGALNLLEAAGRPGHRATLREDGWRQRELFDERTGYPRWPWYFSHHAWRVGHWIGGVPAIVLSLWRLSPELSEHNRLPNPHAVLDRSDRLIDADTGLLRPYRAEALQDVFRFFYRFRHHPDAGAIGGIAHLHWVNYALGRLPYKGARGLFDRAWTVLARRPFMEETPYCLDFDIVQVARTAISDGDMRAAQLQDRFHDYAGSLVAFYGREIDTDYPLHKLPGGLATLHECALARSVKTVPDLAIPPVDIAKQAYWI